MVIRVVGAVGAFVVVVLVALSVLWRQAYDRADVPQQAPSYRARAPMQLTIHDHGGRVEAETPQDAQFALGYLHGWKRPWITTLYRQVAQGRLSAWPRAGAGATDIDLLAHAIDFYDLARRDLSRLSEADREALDQFTRGYNAARADPAWAMKTEMVLLPPAVLSTLEPFTPLDMLAIGRVWMWLLDAPTIHGSTLQALQDTLLSSLAWSGLAGHLVSAPTSGGAGSDSEGAGAPASQDIPTMYVRYGLGNGMLPILLLTEVRLGTVRTVGLQFPGLPRFLAGHRSDMGYFAAAVRQGRLSMGEPQQPFTRPISQHGRFVGADLKERLVVSEGKDDTLWIGPGKADTLWWKSLIRPTLWEGLHMTTESWYGAYSSTSTTANGLATAVENARFKPAPQIVRRSGEPPSWMQDTYSPWAAGFMGCVSPYLDARRGQGTRVQEAVTYLSNWNYDYAPNAIAPTILHRWFTVLREARYLDAPAHELVWSDEACRDLVTGPAFRQYFPASLEQLVADRGEDMRMWQWYLEVPVITTFPYWGARPSGGSFERFGSQQRSVGGHPTTVRGGADEGIAHEVTLWMEGPSASVVAYRDIGRWEQWLSRYTEQYEPTRVVNVSALREQALLTWRADGATGVARARLSRD
jgi:hypothetical protein